MSLITSWCRVTCIYNLQLLFYKQKYIFLNPYYVANRKMIHNFFLVVDSLSKYYVGWCIESKAFTFPNKKMELLKGFYTCSLL